MLEEWANLTVKRVDPEQSVSRLWMYCFTKRLASASQISPGDKKNKTKK
jgi:hypothetical protein